MAIISETMESSSGGVDGEGHQNYTVNLIVVTDSALDGPETIHNSLATYQWGCYYYFYNDVNIYARCNGIGPATLRERDGHKRVWNVPCTFTTKDSSRDSTPQRLWTSPLNEPWKISGSYARSTKNVDRDKSGTVLQVSSKERKVVTIPDGHDTLHLEGPLPSISLPTRAQLIFHVNSATIWGLTARKLLCVAYNYEIRYFNVLVFTIPYVYVSIDFEINYDGWNEVFLDAGLFEYDSTKTGMSRWSRILDDPGHPVQEPVPLDNAGAPLQPGSTSFTYHTKQVIKEYDFTTLGFPDPLPGPFVP